MRPAGPNGWTGEDWLASTCKTSTLSVSQVIGGFIGVTYFHNKGKGKSWTLELDLTYLNLNSNWT